MRMVLKLKYLQRLLKHYYKSKKERNAKSIMLLAIPDEYQLRFHIIKDTKSLWAAIKSRFGGNIESKKMQKNVLKQQFENFFVSDTEGLDKVYDRFQKLISQLEIHGAAVSNKDANQKFLRALPSSWNNITLIMRNKEGIDELDIDDLYNNLKVFEGDIKGSSGSSSNSHNVAFLSAEDTNSINEVNIANGVSTVVGHSSQGQASSSSYTNDLMFSFFADQSSGQQHDDEDLEQLDQDNLEEIDIKWNGDTGYRSRDNTRRTIPVETSNALVGIFGWILVTGTFVLCGVFLVRHNVTTDTCVSMNQWVENPTSHTALDDILPCVDNATALETSLRSREVTSPLVNVINQVYEETKGRAKDAVISLFVKFCIGPALVTTKDARDAVTLLQSLAGLTFDSIQLVLPLAWDLASKLYGFKENKSTNGGLSRMDSESSTAVAALKCCLSNVLVLKEVSHYCLGTRLICAASVYFMLLMQDLILPVVISYVNAAIDTIAIGFKRRSPGCIFTLTAIAKWECSLYGRALALHARGTGDSRSSDGDDNQTNDRFKKDNEYHAVPPPLTGNYMPPLADLSFTELDDFIYRPTANKTSASVSQVETSITPPSNTSVKMPRVESVRPSGVIIEDWVSDDEEDIFQPKDSQTIVKPSFKMIEFTKARNEPVKSDKQAVKPRMATQYPKVDRKDWNGKMTQKLGLGFWFTKKACFVCRSHNHLIKDCDFHEKKMPKESVLRKGTGHKEVRPIWNNTQRINHQNKFVPTAVLTRVSKEKVNTVRVNGVNTAGQKVVSIVKGNGVTAVKASAGCVWRPKMTDLNNGSKDNSGSWISERENPQQALKYKGMFDIRCSKHMTGNKALLTDYQDTDGGFVAFGGSTRGGKITGIGKIRTNKIDFEDVFFVKELKFNLFSVVQMCDKKNSILFTKTECLVLSPDFKLINESQVLLRVLRQNNMYSFDLKNGVPSGDLTCLFAKATIDESKLWHRRLGYVNFKTMNKLVKGNLVRGLPSKTFENDHTCVACQKGKQHKASCLQDTNGNSGLKKNVDAGQTKKENVSTQEYIMFPLWSSISSSYKSSDDKAEDDTVNDDACKKTVQEPTNEYDQALKNVLDKMMDQDKEAVEQSYAVRKEFEA
ncbi:ribonuclease H-like domain-containing protein [Tanacetum coccineum]